MLFLNSFSKFFSYHLSVWLELLSAFSIFYLQYPGQLFLSEQNCVMIYLNWSLIMSVSNSLLLMRQRLLSGPSISGAKDCCRLCHGHPFSCTPCFIYPPGFLGLSWKAILLAHACLHVRGCTFSQSFLFLTHRYLPSRPRSKISSSPKPFEELKWGWSNGEQEACALIPAWTLTVCPHEGHWTPMGL